MKNAIYCGIVVMTIAISSPVLASGKYRHDSYVDYAKVVKVRPLTRSVKVDVPRR